MKTRSIHAPHSYSQVGSGEHRSIRLLEAAGYACTRAAASLGAWDIIGVGSTDFALVQVKTRDWPGSVPQNPGLPTEYTHEQMEFLRGLIQQHDA